MIMTSRLRKFALTAHVTSSVGWLGTVAGFQALAIAAVRSREPEAVRGFYLAMELIGWYVIVPFCLASLVTGLIMSLGTPWGLFRHYWVLVKFLITVVSALILFGFTQTLSSLGDLAADPTLSMYELSNLKQSPVLHSGGGLLAILVTTILAVYKPWGMTPYGRRKANTGVRPERGSTTTIPWRLYLLFGIIGLVLLFLVLHLIAGGPRGHLSIAT
jgi:uncharacterized membrane protein